MMAELAGRALLDLLDAETASWLAENGKRRRYSDGETIHFRGDRDPSMCIVISGAVRIVRQRADGGRSFVSVIAAGQHFADVLMFPDRSARTHDAEIALILLDHDPAAAPTATVLGALGRSSMAWSR